MPSRHRTSESGTYATRPASARVLVVDDDLDSLEAMELLLDVDGHVVTTARSAEIALAHIREGRTFDCIFCDFTMPGMNGIELAREICRIVPGVRMYLLSGWSNPFDSRDERRALFVDVLAKPVPADRILAITAMEGGRAQSGARNQSVASGGSEIAADCA